MSSTLDEKATLTEPVNNTHGHDHEKVVDSSTTANDTCATTDEEATSPPPPAQAGPQQQKWNEPRVNIFRFCTTLYSFILMGMNDGAIGALIPYIEDYYHISYTVLSLVFLAPFIGYLLAALLNNKIHHKFGQLGVAILGPLGRLIGYFPMAFHPPYPALPIVMLFPGFGSGLEDSAWNAWIGNMQNANELLGVLHGAYGLGATIGPLIATAMVTRAGLPWYAFYYLMIALSGLEFTICVAAFNKATGAAYRQQQLDSHNIQNTGEAFKRTTTRTVLKNPITWLLALFLLGYVGAEVSLGGWIVTFMLEIRRAEPFMAGLTVTFFWLGLTVGRVTLGFVTGRIGEKLAITVYLLLSIGLQLLYWLVPNFAASAVFVTFLGFFLGPLFPAAIVAATKLLSSDYHVSAIGFAAAFGGGGAAIFPFAVGAIAQSKGVGVLQPVVLAILVFILFMWWLLPGGLRAGGLERARENKEKVGHEIRKGVRSIF
ncbi:major facilitator superfamily domain-containing protein [Diplogelasinospora grovesii]|uniref:Major facilitator superfamily domain-containing protein n=1 Tax=Diplogelasinospora grovesii TaxID=303347 RepID=A0AAN6NI81_9PEZI|nr:major facilitator superfamily domain-containing protein [Diplogelasinospora grovesii]